MEILSIGILAGVMGFIYTFVQSHVLSKLPQNSFFTSKWGTYFVTGGFILVSIVAATFLLRMVGLSKHSKVPGGAH